MERAEAIIKRFDKSKKIIGVEVGVYKGKLSLELLTRLPRLKLYMVDRWHVFSLKEILRNKGSSMARAGQDIFNDAYKKTCKRAKNFPKRAIILKFPSLKAAKLFKNRTLNFVFLDDDHSTKAVSKNITAWLPKIKKGGYICGHDYIRPSVKKAIHHRFLINEIEIDQGRTWFVKVK